LIGIWELQQEVINGGFFQYMHNSSGEHEPAMREILKAVGAQRTLAILQRAVELIGPNIGKTDYLTALNALPTENRHKLDALEMEFYGQMEDLASLLFRYLSRHRDQLDAPDEFWKEVTIQ
jgi:CHAD domain-containing protein